MNKKNKTNRNKKKTNKLIFMSQVNNRFKIISNRNLLKKHRNHQLNNKVYLFSLFFYLCKNIFVLSRWRIAFTTTTTTRGGGRNSNDEKEKTKTFRQWKRRRINDESVFKFESKSIRRIRRMENKFFIWPNFEKKRKNKETKIINLINCFLLKRKKKKNVKLNLFSDKKLNKQQRRCSLGNC